MARVNSEVYIVAVRTMPSHGSYQPTAPISIADMYMHLLTHSVIRLSINTVGFKVHACNSVLYATLFPIRVCACFIAYASLSDTA